MTNSSGKNVREIQSCLHVRSPDEHFHKVIVLAQIEYGSDHVFVSNLRALCLIFIFKL